MSVKAERLLDLKEFSNLKNEHSLCIGFVDSDEIILRNVEFDVTNSLNQLVLLEFDAFTHEPEEEFDLSIQLHIKLKVDENKNPQVFVDYRDLAGLTIENKSKLTSKNYVQLAEMSKHFTSEIDKRVRIHVEC